MIIEISAIVRVLENLSLCSQITLKLVIFRTIAVLTDLNRRRNLIKQLYILDQAIVDPFQLFLKFQPFRGSRKPCLCSQITLKLLISRTMAFMIDLNGRGNLIKQFFMLDHSQPISMTFEILAL